MDFPWLTEELPDDIAKSIFLKLPVKSLIRFRSLSKSISATLQSPDFIAFHYSFQKQNRDPQILIQLRRSRHRDNRPNFTALPTDFHPREDIKMFFWDDSPEYPTVDGSCNGLLCLSSYDRIAIWNPSTRELKHVPPSTVQRPPDVEAITFGPIGFGFDARSREYKVIRFITNYLDGGASYIRQVEIYCLNSNSWREICPLKTAASGFTRFGDFDNSLFHWRGSEGPGRGIITFDMINESFTETTPPPEFEEEDTFWHFVNDSDGPMRLIAYPFRGEDKVFDLWVNKNKNGWIKELSLGPLPGVKSPLGSSKDGDLFFESKDGELLLIDVRSGEMKNFGIFAYPQTLNVILHVESLIPICGRTEQQECILREIIH